MELLFLGILFLSMIIALTSGFPVAFSLPGSAIFTIGLAALAGYLFAGDPSAYFAQDGPGQWLSAGVTNFRSLYWIVERDTLIAIPLFVFMGIMLQRSKIAEDLLVAMAQLFGPVPGGLGISVVFVGALLAATTGIVGATVIAMGMISLPAMLRNNYSKSLACGTICASGTLGQIIPPSIVLIILADQLSSAADQANTARKALYRETTGEFSMPSHFDVVSASAGDMFMGALIPGLILVGLYMLYILISAILKPETAPPVPMDGNYDRQFAKRVLLTLVPPLTLIFVVLGSIILGVATVNQAGAIGAVGAMLMGSYRLHEGKPRAYWPAFLAIASIIVLGVLLSRNTINVKSISSPSDGNAIILAGIASFFLTVAIVWAAWRAYKTDNTLSAVMVETAKTTSMVFIILIGAAMLTSAFRAFGGEELVKHALTSLPGGFWTQFIVVMLVIFFLGFFLDFIEIAVVVVPIVAPILLANPEANITAVWLGVMVGLNIQTSFLTPPFGFALFYLRGVAPKSVKTTQIYKGVVMFIGLQLLGLAIAGMYPILVNYLPNRTYLTSETAPPPVNPKLQLCLEEYAFEQYSQNQSTLQQAIDTAARLDLSTLPDSYQTSFTDGVTKAAQSFGLIEAIGTAEAAVAAYSEDYAALHHEVRAIQASVKKLDSDMKTAKNELRLAEPNNQAGFQSQLDYLSAERERLLSEIPADWEPSHKVFVGLSSAENKARLTYRRNADESYEVVKQLKGVLSDIDAAATLETEIDALYEPTQTSEPATAMDTIKSVENQFSDFADMGAVKTLVSKARRALKGDTPDRDQAKDLLDQAKAALATELSWRSAAKAELESAIDDYDSAIKHTIGLRQQERLTLKQAKEIAVCQSEHKDISLQF